MSIPGIAVILWVTVILTSGVEAQDPVAGHGEDFDRDLSGVWQVRVEQLSLWAPRHTLNKTIGRTRWQLAVTGGVITLSESCPDPSPDVGHEDTGFEAVEVTEAVVSKDLIAFKVEGAGGAHERYRLEQFAENQITGTYVVWDGTSEYRGRLVLENLGQRE